MVCVRALTGPSKWPTIIPAKSKRDRGGAELCNDGSDRVFNCQSGCIALFYLKKTLHDNFSNLIPLLEVETHYGNTAGKAGLNTSCLMNN